MKIAILSNVNLDLLIQMQQKKNEVFEPQGYGQWVYYALNEDVKLSQFSPKCIFILIDGFALLESYRSKDEGFAEIDRTFVQINALCMRYSNIEILISSIDCAPKRINIADNGPIESVWSHYWDEKLTQLCFSLKNSHRFELSQLIYEIGRKNFYSEKMWYLGSVPYSIKGITALSEAIDDYITKLTANRKKVLILDLDNTLWGGVLGEEGVQGITLGTSLIGATYRDSQKRIKEIMELGVLLAIISKNNPEEIDALFAENSQMVLQKDDFVAIYANWEAKTVNVLKLAEQINLGLDSFVFLDDNEVEREAIRRNLPQVVVADFPKDVSNLPKTIKEIYDQYFWQWKITAEDKLRTEQYQKEALRQQELETAASIDDYLLSLNIRISINEVREDQIERTVQLINKTNQFNTCTLRFDLHDFIEYINNPKNSVYVVNVSDKYGDSGIISVVMISRDGCKASIDNILMSCRVMGRQIEDAIVEAIENKLYIEGITELRAKFIPTAKNKPVADLWDRLGFSLDDVSTNGEKKYHLELKEQNVKALLEAIWE